MAINVPVNDQDKVTAPQQKLPPLADTTPKSESPFPSLLGWFTTVDHKIIGLMYIIFALFNAVAGGALAGAMRAQLAFPEGIEIGGQVFSVMTPDFYNQAITIHGTLMVFFVVAPFFAGFGNYLVPLMIGARDMAFPKMNAFAFWLFVPSVILIYVSMYFGTNAAGWTSYPPLTSKIYMPTPGMDMWIMAMHLAGISSILGSINFIVTIATMRAPGMGWFKMPLFCWTMLTVSWMTIIGVPVFAGGITMLLTDRMFGTGFFDPGKGGDPLLFQHLFWFYNHPTVYITVLPGFGMISHILASFSNKPIFGYTGMVWATAGIGVLSFLVWGHHMFSAGIEPWMRAYFGFITMLIAVPTGVKVFSWLATIWGGSIRFSVAMMYGLAFIAIFTFGGVTGVFLSNVPFDVQVHDSYFVVAHFHYTYFGGAIMSILGGFYFWFPKATGRFLSEKLGRIAFWCLFLGFNLTFFPMHWLGLAGMARRIYTYRPEFLHLNQVISVAYILMAVGGALLIYDVIYTLIKRPATAKDDAWVTNEMQQTLDWETSSPPPKYNFARIPKISA